MGVRKKIIILFVFLLIVVIVYCTLKNTFKDNRVPQYDFNATWSCSKYDSNDTRTYTFNKNNQVIAELDSKPSDNYLIGTYKIESEEIDDSLYTKERDGKVKSYKLSIIFKEFVQNGIQTNQDSVLWYVKVYNGNYMNLILPGGSYNCTMK